MLSMEIKDKIYNLIQNTFLCIAVCLFILITIALVLWIITSNPIFLIIEAMALIVDIALDFMNSYISSKIINIFIEEDIKQIDEFLSKPIE